MGRPGHSKKTVLSRSKWDVWSAYFSPIIRQNLETFPQIYICVICLKHAVTVWHTCGCWLIPIIQHMYIS
jgi:hypothetical protein